MASMVTDDQAKLLQSSFRGKLLLNEPMKNHTSFQIGGPADVLAEPYDVDSLKWILRVAWDEGLPLFILGNGTNLLVADEGIRGIVLRIGRGFDTIQFEGNAVRAGSGVSMPVLARACGERGLSGLEWAVGIPGSLGGALTMNAGAYSNTVADVTREVAVVSVSGVESVKLCDEMHFAQRTSRLSQSDMVAVSALLALQPGKREDVERRMAGYMNDRRLKQPLQMPSAGCVFQNPSGRGAGRYIDAAGLKGLRVGGAEISNVHANFIVNVGGASARDVLILMSIVRKTVYEKFGVDLVPEVRVVGG